MTALGSNLDSLITPSAPLPDSCLSYWQRTTRSFAHLNSNKSTPLPPRSKYIIIGSGISGALTAFSLLENGVPGPDVLILEAREAASGASSRNAGHVRPDAFRGFNHYSKLHGPEQALEIIANERLVLQKIDDFVRKHEVDCDFNLTTTFDVCMTSEFAKYEKETFEAFEKAGGDVSHVKFFEGEEVKIRTRVKDAICAYEWPAASSHPAKLAQWLLSATIQAGVKLYTHCPVSRVSKAAVDETLWEVETKRGTVVAEHVVHCTNAHAVYLLPCLDKHLVPNRAQAHSLIAPPSFVAEKTLSETLSLRYSLQHFYSVIQRKGDGTIILGVSRTNPTLSTETMQSVISWDDGSFNKEIVEDALRQWDSIFPEEGKQIHGEGLDHAWTGIIAMTGDGVPFVGPVKGKKGQWICAGFGGHGMARIFACAPAVAMMTLGHDWGKAGLPECFKFTEERLSKMTGK